MSTAARPSPAPAAPAGTGRARAGVSLMFFTNGVLLATLLPRYPEIKAGFGLGDAAFGLLVIGFPAGAIAAAVSAGPLIRRYGTLATNAVGSLLLAASLAVAGHSGQVWLFAAAMVVGGASDAVVDAAQNVQGVLVEQWRGRSIINSFHALWSVGAATGGAIGALAAGADVAVSTQMTVSAVVWGAVAVGACALAGVPDDVRRAHRSEPRSPGAADAADATGAEPRTRPGRARALRLVLPFVLLAICGTLVEDVAQNWAALFLTREGDAPRAVAGLGLTVALGSQFVGRLLGDPMTDRWGREAVARTGGVLIAIGSLMIVLSPAYGVALAGFGVAGFGCATLVPAAFAAAGRVPGLPEGTGIAILGWLMRLGFLATSPIIGAISDAADLRTAMLVPVVAGVGAALLAHAAIPARPPLAQGPRDGGP